MHALIPSQHTMPLWRRTSSSLPSSDYFSPSPLPSLHPGYAFGSFIASACSRSAKQRPMQDGESRSDSIKSAASPRCFSVLP